MKDSKVFPNKIYHATIIEHLPSIKNRILINRKDALINLDFGKGFYTTTNVEQAKERAFFLQEKLRDPRKRTLSKSHRGIVIAFDLNIDLLYNLSEDSYKIFNDVDFEWADFIVKNRTQKQNKLFNHNFHWTYGSMADGNAGYICGQYNKGHITDQQLMNGFYDKDREEAIDGLHPYRDNYDQLVFHNEEWVNQGVLSNPTFDIIDQNRYVR